MGVLQTAWARVHGTCGRFALAVALATWASASPAQLITWTGAGANTSWSTGLNWSTGLQPVNSGTLVFTGTSGTSSSNNIMSGTFGGLSFTNTGATGSNTSFTLSGNAFTLAGSGSITTTTVTSGTLTDTLAMNIVLGANATVTANTRHNLTVSGTISGSGFGLTKAGAATLTLSGSNTFDGPVSLQNGTVQVNSINDAGTAGGLGTTGTVTIGNANNSSTLDYRGGAAFTNRQFIIGSGTGTGGAGFSMNGTSGLTFTNATFNAATSATNNRTLTLGGSAGTSVIEGMIQDNVGAGGTVGLNKNGTHVWRLSGTNTFSGNVFVLAGKLQIDSWSALGTGTNAVTMSNATNASQLEYLGASGTTSRQLKIGSGNGGVSSIITLLSNGSGPIVFSSGTFNQQDATNTSATARVLELSGTNTGINEIQGAIVDNAANAVTTGTGAVALSKTGAGRWVLSGGNTYSGSTSVTGGQLRIDPVGSINSTSGITLNGSGAEFKYNSATPLTRPLTLTRGTLSGTGTINTAVTVGANAIHSPGNSPGIQAVASETWGQGGTYLWEINDWNGTAGDVSNGFDQIAVTSTLDVAADSGSPFTIQIVGLTGGNAVGAVTGFDNTARKAFTIATSGSLTNFAANKFTLDSSGSFSGSNPLNNGGFTIGNSGNDVVLTYVPSAVYDLTAAASAAAIRVGGTSWITATVTSSTAAVTNPDSVAYNGLALSGGVGGLSSTSGTLTAGLAGSGSGAFTTLGSGSYAFNPTVTTATNVTIATSANAGTTSGATVLVYNPASANTLSAVSLGNIHANDSFGTQGVSIWNTGTAIATYQEGLAASISGTSGSASGSGSIGNLFASSTSTAISVGLAGANTATGGVRSGTVTVGFTSTGTTSGGATGLTPLLLTAQNVAVTGTVWNYAAANTISGTIDLGTVLKGTSLSQALSITNTAPTDGFSEKLDAAFGTLTGDAVTNAGSIGLLAAGGTNSLSMVIGLGSLTAGDKSGSAQVNFTSNGADTSGLGTTSLDSQTVSMVGTVLDPAVASFLSSSTTTSLLLDFGTVQQNASVSPLGFDLWNLMQTNSYTADLALLNVVSGTGNTGAITTTLTALFNNLASGTSNAYTASLATDTVGSFMNIYTLEFKSANNGSVFTSDTPQLLTLTVQGVIAVPEPGALALAGVGIGLAGWSLRNRRRGGQ